MFISLFCFGGAAAFHGGGQRPRLRPRSERRWSRPAGRPFADFSNAKQVSDSDLQQFMRADIMRRYTELTLLGWLGRAYLAIPFFERLFPQVFALSPYGMNAAACYSGPQFLDCVLKESSVGGPKGIPFRLQFDLAPGCQPSRDTSFHIEAATLRSIGCDLRRQDAAEATSEGGLERMSEEQVQALSRFINTHTPTKRLVVSTITSTIFKRLAGVGDAVKQQVALEASGATTAFSPRQEFWALEGTSMKWVQEISGYYFAASVLQDVCFASAVSPAHTESAATTSATSSSSGDVDSAVSSVPTETTAGDGVGDVDDTSRGLEGVAFTFYWDPTEPPNSDDPFRIFNPEVINCRFL